MAYEQDFKDWLLSHLDGTIDVVLLQGDKEYLRTSVNFEDGVNTEEAKFGPYEANIRTPITGYKLYMGDMCICTEEMTPFRPVEDEFTVYPPGSIQLSAT